MRVAWTRGARSNLLAIARYIARDNPTAAIRVADDITAAVEQLSRMPHMGRAGRLPETREWVVQGTPYLVVYRVRSESLDVLRVLHGAQKWPGSS